MLHDGRQRHRERPGEFAHRQALLLPVEPGKQGAPGRIGQRGEGPVEDGALMVNHNVNN